MLTIIELRKQAKVKGTKIYAIVKFTDDDEICVEVKKSSFLDEILGWKAEDLRHSEIEAQITDEGDILL